MRLVVDATVAVKWFLRRPDENFLSEAEAIANLIDAAETELFTPSHWIAEVVAVVARLEPSIAGDAIKLLTDMRPVPIASIRVLSRAAELSFELNHHLFDTLYHAVALEVEGTLVTADERYFAKAMPFGAITLLSDCGSWNS